MQAVTTQVSVRDCVTVSCLSPATVQPLNRQCVYVLCVLDSVDEPR